jgi:type I restriction enzyme S subunit
VKRDVDPNYLYAYFNTSSYWMQITQSKSGSAQAGVNATRLSSLRIPIAPIHQQKQVAEMLSAIDTKVTAEKQRKAALETVFQSALEQLITGQIRLIPEKT